MRALIDTHILLWALADNAELSKVHRDILNNAEAEIYVSAVSVWEIAIKRALGKLIAPSDLVETIKSAGCRPLPISWNHADRAGGLPLHHADPFDRLLIAQSQCENIPLASKDSVFSKYEVELI